MHSTQRLGLLFVIIGALSFSTSIIFIRQIAGLDAASVALFRATAGFLFFSLLLSRTPKEMAFQRYRASIKILIGLGLSVGATALLYIFALQHTSAANAVILNNSATVYVALLAPWLLKESRPRYTWMSLCLAIIGIICIAGPTDIDLHSGTFSGIVAALLCGFTYAFTMLFSRMLRGRVKGMTQVWWSTGIAALVALPWVDITAWSAVLRNLHWLLALGTISLSLPYMLYFMGLERVDAQIVSVVGLLEPVSGVLISILLFQEIPNVLGMVGIVMILISIGLISR